MRTLTVLAVMMGLFLTFAANTGMWTMAAIVYLAQGSPASDNWVKTAVGFTAASAALWLVVAGIAVLIDEDGGWK